MKRCYISGKISGLPEHEYKNNFKAAEIAVQELGYIPVNPVELPHDHDKSWYSYMKESVAAMLTCDCIYVQFNFGYSKVAKIELELAVLLGMEVIYE